MMIIIHSLLSLNDLLYRDWDCYPNWNWVLEF